MNDIATVSSPAGQLHFRPEHNDDDAFRYRLFCDSRTKEWDTLRANPALFEQLMQHQFNAQSVSYRTQFPGARFDIIQLEGRAIGRIVVDRPGSMIHVIDLAIVPSLRGRGIGTAIMEGILHDAQQSAVPVQLYVSSENDPSLRLYRRLGFVPIVSDPSYIMLEWRFGATK